MALIAFQTLQESYETNADYLDDASMTKGRAFSTACATRWPASRPGHTMRRMDGALDELSGRLGRLAMGHDLSGEWPADSLRVLEDFDCWRWIVPRECGGVGWRGHGWLRRMKHSDAGD